VGVAEEEAAVLPAIAASFGSSTVRLPEHAGNASARQQRR
jgi:hypothetical protein